MKQLKLLLLLLVLALTLSAFAACGPEEPCTEHVDVNGDEICDNCEVVIYDFPACESHLDAALDGKCDICERPYETITVAKALELCGESGNITEERFYVRAKVSTIKNAAFGEMNIADDTGEIYVYGTYSYDGALPFNQMTSTPARGDEVVLHCVLQNYNGTKEVKNARLVGFKTIETDISDFTSMSIADARSKAAGELIAVEGVVARITYANGYVPSGVMLVDETGSIYVYGADVAGAVQIGNKIKVAGVKDFWILDTETNNASKYGYGGCNQLSDAILISNDNGKHDFDKTAIEETTVKAIMDTPVTEDITTKIFKVTALVKKVPGSGFVNYYIDDLDGTTGSYVYTQCNGGDFEWLDQFDGKICTVYLTALNAKSNAAGCVWRFLPVAVVDEGYTFDLSKTAQFVLDYYGMGQLLNSYAWNAAVTPSFPLVSSVNSELLGFENATISYSSSNTDVLTFVTKDGETSMKLVGFGKATVTVTVTYGSTTATGNFEITSTESADILALKVSEAIAATKGEVITVRGIVGPSLVNKVGFYLIDESGVIAVTGPATIFEGLAIGNEVVIRGTRNVNVKDTTTHAIGQTYISDIEILANDYAVHDYSTESFKTGATLVDIYNFNPLVDYSASVYVVTGKVVVVDGGYSSNIYLEAEDGTQLRLYSSSASQYNWIKAFAGQTVTVELAPCNWNDKNYYTGCVLAVVNSDGTKVYNTLNFTS